METAIKKTYEEAKKRSAKYPELVNMLFEAGVSFYTVDMVQRTITYVGKNEEEYIEEKFCPELSFGNIFDLEKVKVALINTQTGKTDYVTFLNEIAAAGVTHYVADMANRVVTYSGNGEEYAENVPTA